MQRVVHVFLCVDVLSSERWISKFRSLNDAALKITILIFLSFPDVLDDLDVFSCRKRLMFSVVVRNPSSKHFFNIHKA